MIWPRRHSCRTNGNGAESASTDISGGDDGENATNPFDDDDDDDQKKCMATATTTLT